MAPPGKTHAEEEAIGVVAAMAAMAAVVGVGSLGLLRGQKLHGRSAIAHGMMSFVVTKQSMSTPTMRRKPIWLSAAELPG